MSTYLTLIGDFVHALRHAGSYWTTMFSSHQKRCWLSLGRKTAISESRRTQTKANSVSDFATNQPLANSNALPDKNQRSFTGLSKADCGQRDTVIVAETWTKLPV
jgi:hypothetical protein